MALKNSFRRSASLAVLACFLINAPVALADYPGEIWSVDALSIKMTDGNPGNIAKSKLRTSLQRANDVYFFGDESVRMLAEISSVSVPTLQLTLLKQSDGSLIARSPELRLVPDGASIESSALAWMEGLTCVEAGCGVAPELQQPVRVAKARLNVAHSTPIPNQLTTATAGQIMAGIPVPVSRPLRDDASIKRGKATIGARGLAGKNLGFTAVPIQIALSIPREVGALTYGDADQLTLDDSIEVARVSPIAPLAATPVQSVPKPRNLQNARTVNATSAGAQTQPPEDTLFGRLLTTVASLLGINTTIDNDALPRSSEEAALRSVVQTSTERTAAKVPTEIAVPKTSLTAAVPVPESTKPIASQGFGQSTWRRASEPVSLINPIERPLRVAPASSVGNGQRIAVADLKARVSDPANVQLGVGSTKIASSQELLLPNSQEQLLTSEIVQVPRTTKTNLSVRLHPDLLGRYGSRSATAKRSARNPSTRNASRTIAGSTLGDPSKLNRVLNERGLEIDVAGYNRFDRIYWSGREEAGFWISMPNRVGSKFVLVSGPKASVIASVRQKPGIARTSAGVAEALELLPRQWAKLRVVSLRAANRSAGVLPLDWFSVRRGRNRIQ